MNEHEVTSQACLTWLVVSYNSVAADRTLQDRSSILSVHLNSVQLTYIMFKDWCLPPSGCMTATSLCSTSLSRVDEPCSVSSGESTTEAK